MNIKDQVNAAYGEAVKAACAATANTSWGVGESVAVIETLADVAYLGDTPEGFDAIRELVKELANPSAFRQKLEKLAPTNPCYIKPTGNKRGGSSGAIDVLKALK